MAHGSRPNDIKHRFQSVRNLCFVCFCSCGLKRRIVRGARTLLVRTEGGLHVTRSCFTALGSFGCPSATHSFSKRFAARQCSAERYKHKCSMVHAAAHLQRLNTTKTQPQTGRELRVPSGTREPPRHHQGAKKLHVGMPHKGFFPGSRIIEQMAQTHRKLGVDGGPAAGNRL